MGPYSTADDVDTLLGAATVRRDPEALRVPMRAGREAYLGGRERDSNPHRAGTLEAIAWRCGHDLERLLALEAARETLARGASGR